MHAEGLLHCLRWNRRNIMPLHVFAKQRGQIAFELNVYIGINDLLELGKQLGNKQPRVDD